MSLVAAVTGVGFPATVFPATAFPATAFPATAFPTTAFPATAFPTTAFPTTVRPSAAGGVTPLLRMSPHRYASVPTTAECLDQSGSACYSPQQLQAAYEMTPLYAAGLTGKGKTIVLVDSFGSPTIATDLATFDKGFGLPNPPSLTIIHPAGANPPWNPANPTMVGWAQETSLDVEYSHAMAPGANILLVETPVAETEGLAGIPRIVKAENYVIDHHLGDVISQSFGASEETFPSKRALVAERSAFINADAHHVTVLASAGDTGATDYSNVAGTLLYTHRVNSWPSSDPLVTSVGGTQLHLDAAGTRSRPDNVWNDTALLGSPDAGGGGLSADFARPAYQNRLETVVGSQRGTPDISMSAAVNGGAIVYLGAFSSQAPGYYTIGGTSEAAPLFAGVVAVADQAAGHDLGLLNPELYALAKAGAPGRVDVTAGNNTVSFRQKGRTYTVPGYAAVRGYDLASGLGTINGDDLVHELAG
jgi:subtilase family serine protease